MDAGFQAFTESGLYQIDGRTPNYQLVQAMSGQAVDTSLQLAVNDAGKPFGATLPSVAFSFNATAGPMYGVYASDSVGITVWNVSIDGGVYTIRFVTERPCAVYFFLFDRTPPVNSGFGFQVFAPDTKLIADTSVPFLRVLDVIVDHYVPDTGFVTIGAPSPQWQSRSYGRPVLVSAIAPVHVGWSYDPAGLEMTSIRVTGGTIAWGTSMWGGGKKPNFTGFKEQWHHMFMVLDATGIL